MYNGIGLQTARGSGTSGHIQKNLSYNLKKPQTKQDFLKELEEKRQNSLAPARKANPQIIQHQRKRQILIQTMRLKKKLQEEGLGEQEIRQRTKKAQKILKQKLQKGQMQTKNKDTHVMTEAKQRQLKKFSKAFGVRENDKIGSAFNFQNQRQERMKKLQQKRQKYSFTCPYAQCGKTYESQQRLDRHTFHKHPDMKQQRNAKKNQGDNEQ